MDKCCLLLILRFKLNYFYEVIIICNVWVLDISDYVIFKINMDI